VKEKRRESKEERKEERGKEEKEGRSPRDHPAEDPETPRRHFGVWGTLRVAGANKEEWNRGSNIAPSQHLTYPECRIRLQ
jgi:hypothetical protein